MLATKAWNKYRATREPRKIVCFNQCGDTTVMNNLTELLRTTFYDERPAR